MTTDRSRSANRQSHQRFIEVEAVDEPRVQIDLASEGGYSLNGEIEVSSCYKFKHE